MTDAGVLHDLPILRFLPDDVRASVVSRFVPTSFPFGTVIAAQGTPTDAMYVLVSGRARVLLRAANGIDTPLNVLQPGDTFGETEILAAGIRPATVRASSDVLALRLDLADLRALVDAHPDLGTYLQLQRKHATLQQFFRALPAFSRLPADAVAGVVLAELDEITVDAGAMVYRQGDPPGPLYLIEDGRVRVLRDEGGRAVYVSHLGAGEFFGAASAIGRSPRATAVEAVTAVRLRTLGADALDRLGRTIPAFRAMLDDQVAQHDYRRAADVPADLDGEILPDARRPTPADPRRDPDVDVADAGDAVAFSPPGPAGRRGRRHVPFVPQVDEADCGAACLAMVTRAFGRRASLARIRQLVETGPDGTSLQAICRAGDEIGLATRSVKSSGDRLDQMPLPAIVHLDSHHWVVLARVGRRDVSVVDPALGRRRLSRAEFERIWTGYAALFDYTPALEQTPESRRLRAWMWPIVRPHAGLLLQALGLAVVVSVLQMVLPVFTQIIVDRVLVEQDVVLLHVLIGGMAATMVFIIASLLVQRYLLSFSAVRMDAQALDVLMRRLLALPISYFASRRTGDIQRRLEGVRQVRDFLVQNGIGGVTAVAQLLITLAVMSAYSPWLTAVFLVTAPGYALLMLMASRLLRPVFADVEHAFSQYHSHQIDAIKGIETVKGLGGESAFRRILLGQFLGVAGKVFRADFTVMSYEAGVEALTFLGTALFLWAGAYEVLAGRLTIGGLVAFNALVALSTLPIRNLLALWDNLQRCGVWLDRLDDVLQHEPEQGHDRSGLRPVRDLQGRVSLENVGFRYGGPESPAVLEHVTLDVPPGRRIAIVGRSGSGKTTLARCLAGLIEPTEGTISFDGLDLKTLSHNDLRRHIGLVLQDSFVFADTIARNIAFGDEEPDLTRVAWAASLAGASEFIDRLPFGYETRIGETGVGLSGGQRQRVCIARALYRKPPILILDEATSALDTELERTVQRGIESLAAGRTVFVIAQRLSTVRDADLIVVLDRGRLVEQGTHDDLMKRRGYYFYLVSQQLGVAG